MNSELIKKTDEKAKRLKFSFGMNMASLLKRHAFEINVF